MKMKAMPGAAFTPHDGEAIVADESGVAEIPDHHVEVSKSHGFEEWVEPPEMPVRIERVEVPVEVEKIVEVEKPEDPNAPAANVVDEFEMLNRNGLFAWLKARDIKAPLPQTNESLKALCREAKARPAEIQWPIVPSQTPLDP